VIIDPQLQSHLDTLAIMEELFDEVDSTVFFVKDRHGRYVLVNRTLLARCGLIEKSEVIGKTAEEVHPSPLGKEYLAQDRHVLDTDTPIKDKLELQLYVQAAPGWCLTYKIPIHGDDGSVVGMTGLSQDLHIPWGDSQKLPELSTVIDHIRSHYDETLRLEDLAAMASLSVYQFEQRMKRIFHVTAGQFIMHTRIDAARDMLRGSRATIAEIAGRCGFCDQSALTRQFKATTGLTPRAFRDRDDASA
jgi:AraC-like DNA-binding protein